MDSIRVSRMVGPTRHSSIRVSRMTGPTRHSQDTAEGKREDLTEEDVTYANAITNVSVNGSNFPIILKTERSRKLTGLFSAWWPFWNKMYTAKNE